MLTHTDAGHALEAGWFLLQFSAKQGDKELQKTAIDKFVELPYQYGWDKEHGGLFYFLDVDGHCPTQVKRLSTHTVCSSGNGCCCIFLEIADVVSQVSAVLSCFDQLEWRMKLWWPHCEALISFLMAYNQTKRPELLERFSQVYEYTFSHVSSNKGQVGLHFFDCLFEVILYPFNTV